MTFFVVIFSYFYSKSTILAQKRRFLVQIFILFFFAQIKNVLLRAKNKDVQKVNVMVWGVVRMGVF